MDDSQTRWDQYVSRAREAMVSLAYLVVQDLFVIADARFVDVVIPASASPEKRGTVIKAKGGRQMGRHPFSLPSDAWADRWIVHKIAPCLGLGRRPFARGVR